jgi:hypothetical protein
MPLQLLCPEFLLLRSGHSFSLQLRRGRSYSVALGRLPHSALSYCFFLLLLPLEGSEGEEMVDSAVRKRMDQIS